MSLFGLLKTGITVRLLYFHFNFKLLLFFKNKNSVDALDKIKLFFFSPPLGKGILATGNNTQVKQ